MFLVAVKLAESNLTDRHLLCLSLMALSSALRNALASIPCNSISVENSL